MPAPELDPRTSLQVAIVGEPFHLQLEAFNDPDTWEALRLPAGLTLDAEEGEISGTATTRGVYQVKVKATNESGSDEMMVLFSVIGNPEDEQIGEWDDLPLDFDLIERTVTIPGVTRAEGEPLFRLGRGDRVNLLVGFIKSGSLRDVQPDGETVSLKLAMREFEPEITLTSAGGAPVKVGSGRTARFRIPVWLKPENWAVLADYEGDRETGMVSNSELELVVGVPLYDQTRVVDDLTLSADLGGDDYGDPDPIEETLVFTGLTATDGASYTLVVSIEVADRPGQNVSLTQTMTITFTGGVWVVSGRTGDNSIQGEAEDGEWRATLGIEAVAGDANSVDVDVSVATTEVSGVHRLAWVIPARITGDLTDPGETVFVLASRLRLFDAEGDEMDAPGEVWTETYTSPAAFLATVADAWAAIAGGGDPTITVASPSSIRIEMDSDETSARTIRIEHHTDPATGNTVAAMINPASAVLTGQLTQVASAEDQPPRFTAQFPIGVIRDMVPDRG